MQTFLCDGLRFRDLDHDGVLAPYEDWRLTPIERAADLVARLNIEEKVGLMLHGSLPSNHPVLGAIGIGDAYDFDRIEELINTAQVRSFITRLNPSPAAFAEQNNRIQEIAASGRFGIPVSVSSDPRHHAAATLGAGVSSSGFSQWPGTLGLAAIGDRELVRRFAEVVKREYRAVGIRIALSPMADLATSPRWPRADGTFGSHPASVRTLVGAYIEGLQGGTAGLGPESVAAVVKHWVGYGASRDGFDGHNYYGRYSAFPGGSFDDHVEGFLDAFEFQVAGVMPTYNILEDVFVNGKLVEQVGAGFSSEILQNLLRSHHGFGGLVVSDWSIMNDLTESARTGNPPQTPKEIAMPWGVERLPRVDRIAKGINAGLDQLGGENDPTTLLAAVERGLVSEQRINESVVRILSQKFAMGLFESPFVDVDEAANVVGSTQFTAEGRGAAQRSPVVLVGPRAPMVNDTDRVYLSGFASHQTDLTVVDDPTQATVAVVRIRAPWQDLHPNFFFGSRQHEGDLDFKVHDPALVVLSKLPSELRKVLVVSLDRPAILTALLPFMTSTDVLMADFEIADEDLLKALTTADGCCGRMPFELPSSMTSVLAASPDQPNGSEHPLFPIFHRAAD